MIGVFPSNYANAVVPFAPVGRAPVSQENEDLKSSSFRPAEQPGESARMLNRRFPDERPNDDVERDRLTRDAEGERDNERLTTEREQIQALAARDREVRAHEQAHASVAGPYARGTHYTYERGPDGVSYAVAGEVQIDTSPIPGDPEATLRKAQQLRRAANAPADPSSQDARVAAQAALMEVQARMELHVQSSNEGDGGTPTDVAGREGSVPDAEKAAEAKKERLAEEERRLQAEQAYFEAEQRELNQRQARAELFNEAAKRNIDIHRRLLEIGVLGQQPAVGTLLNKKV